MIFSKDKKPKTVGFYWWKYPAYPPSIVEVEKQCVGGSRLKVRVYGMPTVNAFTASGGGILWGDKIEIPTVEDSEHLGRQG